MFVFLFLLSGCGVHPHYFEDSDKGVVVFFSRVLQLYPGLFSELRSCVKVEVAVPARLSVLTIILRFPWTKAITTITITMYFINPSGKLTEPPCWTPCSCIGLSMSLICQPTSENIKQHNSCWFVCLFVIVNAFVCFFIYLFILYFFYVRVDTVISRNGFFHINILLFVFVFR